MIFKLFAKKRLFLLLFFLSYSKSESYWVRYGWQVFNSAGDARILSLGGAAVTDYGTAISPLFNPAASNRVGLHNINYTHQSRLAGMINSDLIGLPIKNFSRPFNLIILHEGIDQIPDTRDILLDFGIDGIPGTGDVGEGNGVLDDGERLDESKLTYFSQRQLGIHVSSSFEINSVEAGFAIKTLYHSLDKYSGTGIGLDIGFIAFPWENGRFGLTIRDVTTSWQVWDNGTVERFKPTIITGFAQTIVFPKSNIKLTAMSNMLLDAGGKMIDDDFRLGNYGGKLIFGLNAIYNNQLALRIGRNSIGSFTTGLGISWENLSLDYAFLNEPSGSGLGSTHLISVSVSADWVKNYIEQL